MNRARNTRRKLIDPFSNAALDSLVKAAGGRAFFNARKAAANFLGKNSPFTNIFTDLVNGVGKNLFNMFDVNNRINTTIEYVANGMKLTASSTMSYVILRFILKPNTNYRLSMTSSRSGATGGGTQLFFYTDGNFSLGQTFKAGNANALNQNYTFNTGDAVCWELRLHANYSGAVGDYAIYNNIQLEEGNIATVYEPHKKNNALLNNFAGTSSSGWAVEWVSKLIRGNKNELPYNPQTWQEWYSQGTNAATALIKSPNGLEVVADGINYRNVQIATTSIKPNTKYGLILKSLFNDLTKQYVINRGNEYGSIILKLPLNYIGNFTTTFTTGATITKQEFFGFVEATELAGRKIALKDFRMIELKPGSQEETDFNTLTADQLAEKYKMPPGQYLPFLRFDGVDDFGSMLNTPAIDITSAPLAVFATVRVPANGAASGYLFSKNLDATSNIQYGLMLYADGAISVMLEGLERKYATGFVPKDVFVNIGFIWNGTTVKLYRNISPFNTPMNYAGTLTSRPNMRIGCRLTTGGAINSMLKHDLVSLSIYAGPNATERNILRAEREISRPYIT